MRTKGKLVIGRHLNRIQLEECETGQFMGEVFTKDDAEDLVACWNAVESIGGDPETVGELVEALKKVEKITDTILNRSGVSDGEVSLANDIFSLVNSALEEL